MPEEGTDESSSQLLVRRRERTVGGSVSASLESGSCPDFRSDGGGCLRHGWQSRPGEDTGVFGSNAVQERPGSVEQGPATSGLGTRPHEGDAIQKGWPQRDGCEKLGADRNHSPRLRRATSGSRFAKRCTARRLSGLRKYTKVWPLYNRWLWEQNKGPIPPGHLVVFTDGNRRHCVIDNLALLQMADNCQAQLNVEAAAARAGRSDSVERRAEEEAEAPEWQRTRSLTCGITCSRRSRP